MTIKIDKDVPRPTRQTTYPFADMEIGDSFFAEGKNGNQLRNAAGHYRKKNGWKFEVEERVENNVKGARIWRIE